MRHNGRHDKELGSLGKVWDWRFKTKTGRKVSFQFWEETLLNVDHVYNVPKQDKRIVSDTRTNDHNNVVAALGYAH